MEITNGQIWYAIKPVINADGSIKRRSPLSVLLEDELNPDGTIKTPAPVLPVKVTYSLVRLARKASEHLRDVEETRNKLFKQYGKEGEQPGGYAINPTMETWAEFVRAHDELMLEKVEFDFWPVALPANNDLGLDGPTLLGLEPFLDMSGWDDEPDKMAEAVAVAKEATKAMKAAVRKMPAKKPK